MPVSNGSLVITVKLKAKENFCMAAMLFYILVGDENGLFKAWH
jgi:hypothetical protein